MWKSMKGKKECERQKEATSFQRDDLPRSHHFAATRKMILRFSVVAKQSGFNDANGIVLKIRAGVTNGILE